MALGRAKARLAQLWQLPLLLFSLGLFAYAGYLFVDPHGGPTVGQRLAGAKAYLKQERFEAARAALNSLLESEKLTAEQEGAARLMLGEALEMGQRLGRISVRANHEQIIRQTKLALNLGIAADADVERRLAESYEALGRGDDAALHYQQAMKLDSAHALKWHRKVIELELMAEKGETAAASIEEYLKHKELAAAERGWALGEKAHLMVDRGAFAEAQALLGEALKLNINDPASQGQYNYWMGYCLWKLGKPAEAERYLRVARDQMGIQQRLDGAAAWLLGKIRQDQKDYAGAAVFYAAVLQGHLDDPSVAQPSRLGRGVCRIAQGQEDAGLSDLLEAGRYIRERESISPRVKDEAVAAIQMAVPMLSNTGNLQGALELMACEQEMQPKPPPEFFATLAGLYERRASQLEGMLAQAKPLDRAAMEQKIREHRTKAGDAFLAYSRGLVLKDDKGYGQAMWKSIELYDAAGDLPRAVSALETFVNERPDDPFTPDALLRLGGTYHAAGLFDKAIAAYKQCQFRYAKSLAAAKSEVPLARAYIAKGPESYAKAEQALRGMVENNPQITPEATEFREALMELAQLYYRTARYEMAVARLEELTQRYPGDASMGQLYFLMADSYRKSAGALDDRIRAATANPTTRPSFDIADANRARSERLTRAKELYQRVIAYYRSQPATVELDKLYQKLSYFYRADCVYDLGDYLEAIKMYDDAAFRYQDDPSALAAYVQIVNANVTLGRIEEAKAANERAKWMLRRMPQPIFEATSYAMPKVSWEQWLKWSNESGVWKQ